MLNRLFGRNKKQAPTPPPEPVAVAWDEPTVPYQTYFNLHIHGLSLDEVADVLEAKYMVAAQSGPAIVVARLGEWVNAYVVPEVATAVGFNKLSGEIAAEQDCWLIGYRIYADAGMDVHYFQGADHVAALAVGEGELEREPESPAIFAHLADVRSVVPRPPTQHPLDFHFALLASLGIQDAPLTWDAALAQYMSGGFDEARLLAAGSDL